MITVVELMLKTAGCGMVAHPARINTGKNLMTFFMFCKILKVAIK